MKLGIMRSCLPTLEKEKRNELDDRNTHGFRLLLVARHRGQGRVTYGCDRYEKQRVSSPGTNEDTSLDMRDGGE